MKPFPIVLSFFVVWTLSCSSVSAPPEAVMEKKNRAADYLNFGQQYFQSGQYGQALQFFLIALDQNTSVDYSEGMAAAYNSIGTTYLALGRVDDAGAALLEAEKIATRIGNQTLVLQNLNNQVQVDSAQGKLDVALTRLQSAMGSAGFPESKEGAVLYHALGVVYRGLGRTDDAVVALERALAINTKLNLKQEMASNYFMLGSLQSKAGNLVSAIASIQKALELDRTMENSVGIGQDLRVLGILAAKNGDKDAALDYLVRSNRVFRAAGLAQDQLKTLDALIALTDEMKKPEDKAKYEAQKKSLLGQD